VKLRVQTIRPLTADIRGFQLVDPAGGELPALTAGAHLKFRVMPNAAAVSTRSCSLVGSRTAYVASIASQYVKRLPDAANVAIWAANLGSPMPGLGRRRSAASSISLPDCGRSSWTARQPTFGKTRDRPEAGAAEGRLYGDSPSGSSGTLADW